MKHFPHLAIVTAGALIAVFGLLRHNAARAEPQTGTASESAPPDAAARAARKLMDEVGTARFTSAGFRPGTVRHMVMFRLRPDVTATQRATVINGFRDLVKLSKRPDGTPVIQSLETGIQDSGEGADQGLELGFLVTFRSQGDRNFYVGTPTVTDPAFFDPAHERYKERVAPFLKQAVVFDFPVDATSAPK
ncbi:Dabb family protein [Acetobacter oeni]|uniref:Stress-response A/B barrel domain-containing protein n=1 Tax=Acetobacter oeni TaxID=304077 RepID=A0A511XLH3_9PROT|nr:Dabb family protein [Acetobacter oeni]MBB3883586.1 hypothetical protein [Acetobacter oeni]NHO19677.1 Dabb family protein [Acetobacter oeni]GBR02793.1 hypothetical protein AA21952_0866 [Acetobacter oeni LMG 21952]GEN63791.1 hypothetical protein AOE01nite_20150 [Acetobacter oeni]